MTMDVYEKMERDGFTHAGNVGVDTGHVWIGDSSHINEDLEVPGHLLEFGEQIGQSRQVEIRNGMAFTSGNGDGLYPVFLRRLPDGRVAEARILFIAEPCTLTDDDKRRIVSENFADCIYCT